MNSSGMIICITGLPGSGKTASAELIIQELGKYAPVIHLTSDLIRTALYTQEALTQSDFYLRDFTPDELTRSYNGLYFVIETILAANPNCIIVTDGTYRESKQRIMLELVADKFQLPFHLIHIDVDERVRDRRGRKRLQAGGHSYTFNGIYEQPIAAATILNNGGRKGLRRQVATVLHKLELVPGVDQPEPNSATYNPS